MVGKDCKKMISIKISMEMESNMPISTLLEKIESPGVDKSNNADIYTKLLSNGDMLSFDGNQFVEFLLTFSLGVASGVVGNYVYNAIHTAAKKLEINGRRTRLTEESISQAIETIKEMLNEIEQGNEKAE